MYPVWGSRDVGVHGEPSQKDSRGVHQKGINVKLRRTIHKQNSFIFATFLKLGVESLPQTSYREPWRGLIALSKQFKIAHVGRVYEMIVILIKLWKRKTTFNKSFWYFMVL